MADVAAQQLAPQDAKHYHRWLQDDAVDLQLWESGDSWDAINSAPEPLRARKWFVGLCLIRFSASFRAALMTEIGRFGRQTEWWKATNWIRIRLMQVEGQPVEYPFSLSPDEWAYYQSNIFGGQVAAIRSFYHPPTFYTSLATEILDDSIDVAASAAAATVFVASKGQASESILAARSVLTGALTLAAKAVVPSVDPDAPRKHRLWPRYLNEARRRELA